MPRSPLTAPQKACVGRIKKLLAKSDTIDSDALALAVFWLAQERWKPMKSAPKDGREIELLVKNYTTGEDISTIGCWMAPNGNEELLGWWCAGAMRGTKSFSGYPLRYSATKITPKKWKHLTIPRQSLDEEG